MANENERLVASNSIRLADYYLGKELPGRSFAHLLVALKLMPEWKDTMKNTFASTLCDWGKRLEAEKRFADLFNCYEQAVEMFPNNEVILNNLGAHLFRMQYFEESKQYFKRALTANKNYLPAFRNLQNVSNSLVERWHFKMLNDSSRNEAFRLAISAKVARGCNTVIDIGTGTGILSLYAVLEGADYVSACDYSSTMVNIADKVFKSNISPFKIHLVNKLSTDMSVPDDLPCRMSLAVTETIDAGVFGEHLLQTLMHAWEQLLLPKQTNRHLEKCPRIIPGGVEIYCCPIECYKIAKRYSVLPNERLPDPKSKIPFDFTKLNTSFIKEEPYDCEELKNSKFKILSLATSIFKVDFNDYDCLRQHYRGNKNLNNVTINCLKEGYLDAIAVWFNLSVDDDKFLSSSPFNPDYCCWEQAIFPLSYPVLVRKNSSFKLSASCTNGKLQVTVNSVDGYSLESEEPVMKLCQPVIKVLNCKSLQQCVTSSVSNIISSKPQIANVLDLLDFPFGGSLFAKCCKAKVVSFNKVNDSLNQILAVAGITAAKITSYCLKDIEHALNVSLLFDVIVFDPIESTGEFSEEIISLWPKIRANLKPGGIWLPHGIQLWCQLVNSVRLSKEYEIINPQLTKDFKLAEYINEYKVSTHIDLDLNTLESVKYSDQFLIGTISPEQINCDDNITFEKNVSILNDGSINAITYWFQYDFGNNIYFSTLSTDSHINQAAEMLSKHKEVEKGSKVMLNAVYYNGILQFNIA